MNQRFLMWGIASITFVVTLAVTSWHDGRWQQSNEIALPARSIRSATLTADDSAGVPLRPFAPTHSAPPAPVETVAAAASPPPPPAPAPVPQEAPPPPDDSQAQVSAQELDEQEFLSHRDRAAERSSRNR